MCLNRPRSAQASPAPAQRCVSLGKHTAPAMHKLDLYKICNLSRNERASPSTAHQGQVHGGHEFTISGIGATQGPTLAGSTGAGSQTHAKLEDCGAMRKCC